MLRFLVTYKEGKEEVIKDVLTARLCSELDVPADSLTITCSYDRFIAEEAQSISARLGDKLVFRGQLDEIISIRQSSGVILKLTARSPAAALLDNEAEPLVYINPSAAFIFHRHLEPFGITQYEEDKTPFYGSMRIDKGMSHWQVLESFCRNRYGAIPRISGSGRIYMKGLESGETVTFGDGGIKYQSIKESRRRYRLISEVRLRMSSVKGYSSRIVNKNPACRDITRTRYVNALADNYTVDTANHMIEQSNLDSYFVQLNCAGCFLDLPGQAAEVNDSVLGKLENLMVKGTVYTLDKNGENTAVILRKGKF